MLCHVTGAKGVVGKEVTRALERFGEVQGTDVDEMDVTNADATMATLAANPPDVMGPPGRTQGQYAQSARPAGFLQRQHFWHAEPVGGMPATWRRPLYIFLVVDSPRPHRECGERGGPIVSAAPLFRKQGCCGIHGARLRQRLRDEGHHISPKLHRGADRRSAPIRGQPDLRLHWTG